MKTPFNDFGSKNFDETGLYKLDFVELEDGWVYAFDMQATKRGEPMSARNSVRVFKRQGVLPEAFELLIAAPLLYKTLIACQRMHRPLIDAAKHMQGYLRERHKINDPTIDFIVKSIGEMQTLLASAVAVPIVGRQDILKNVDAPLDGKGN